jgi:hypothetical protein
MLHLNDDWAVGYRSAAKMVPVLAAHLGRTALSVTSRTNPAAPAVKREAEEDWGR